MLKLWAVLGQPVLAAISQDRSWGPGMTAGSMAHTWPFPLGHPPGPGYPIGPGHPSTTPSLLVLLACLLADSHLDTMELSKDILEEVLYEGEKGLGTGGSATAQLQKMF